MHIVCYLFSGSVDYKTNVNVTDFQQVVAHYDVNRWQGCELQIDSQLKRIMHERSLPMPTNVNEALNLFTQIVDLFAQIVDL